MNYLIKYLQVFIITGFYGTALPARLNHRHFCVTLFSREFLFTQNALLVSKPLNLDRVEKNVEIARTLASPIPPLLPLALLRSVF